MKKTNFIACMIAVVAITISTACNKEMDRPSGNVNNAVTPAAQILSTSAITKGPTKYVGQSTLGDSTKTTNP